MKHIIIFLAILLSVYSEQKEITFAVEKVKLYELADIKANSIEKGLSDLVNVEVIEEGEEFHQISYFNSEDKKSEIAFIEATTVALSTKNEKIKKAKLKKLEIEKTLLSTLKKEMGIKNTKEINIFLEDLPQSYQQDAIERHKTKQTLKVTQKKLQTTKVNIGKVTQENSQLTQNNAQATKKNDKLDKENKELEDSVKANVVKIDELKVAISAISDERKKEVKIAEEKRYTWAAIAAVLAIVLGFILNR